MDCRPNDRGPHAPRHPRELSLRAAAFLALCLTVAWVAVDAGLLHDTRHLTPPDSSASGRNGNQSLQPTPVGSAAKAANTSGAPSASSPQLPGRVDLGAVMRQVHFAFRPDGTALVGGHSTYTVKAEAGRVRLTPHRQKDAPGSSSPSTRADLVEGTLDLETSAVSRGDRSVLTGSAKQHVGGSGELVVERGPVTETWTNGEGGSEQGWRFPARPEGSGNLEVAVAASGLDYAGATDSGLHFADKSGLGFRYTHAKWVDARGAQVTVPASYRDGRIVMHVPGSVVDGATYPAILDPVVGPEFGMDQPVYAPSLAAGDQIGPRIAFDGTNFLVAWLDNRNSEGVYVARVSTLGVVLDPWGIFLGYGSHSPVVSFDGTGYLVLWPQSYSGLRAVRVTTAGEVLDVPPITVSNTSYPSDVAAMAFDGTNHLLVWSSSSDSKLYATRLSTTGAMLDTPPIVLDTVVNTSSPPSVAFDGANYLVVWAKASDIFGRRVSPAGAVLDASPISVSTATANQVSPAVAFDGTNHFVVWQDYRNSPYSISCCSDVYGTRISPAGVVLDSAGIAVSTTAATQSQPAVAFDGTNYMVAWHDTTSGQNSLRGTHVSTAGAVSDPLGFPLSSTQAGPWSAYAPALAFGGADYLVVWTDGRNVRTTGEDIFANRVSPAGAVLHAVDIPVSTTANRQTTPAVAFDGMNYLVAWEDYRNDATSDIFGARVSQQGVVLDTSGIALTTAATSQNNPSMAFDGTNYLVMWEDHRNSYDADVFGTRVSPAGEVLDPAGIPASTAPGRQTIPAIASDGAGYLVVWQDNRNDSTNLYPDVYGTRIGPDGAVLDANGIAVKIGPQDEGQPSVAFDGTNYLVVHEDADANQVMNIFATRVTTAGVVLDGTGIQVSAPGVNEPIPSGATTAVAFDGTNYLVVWRGSAGWNQDYDVLRARRLSPGGIVLDPAEIRLTNLTSGPPSVAFDGVNYVLAFDWNFDFGRNDVFGMRISPTGVVLDPDPFLISAYDYSREFAAKVASNGAGAALVVYHTTMAATGYIDRVAGRILGTDDLTCDGVDDDGDGAIDEDYPSIPTTCGVGACAAVGLRSCSSGTVVDSCAPGAPAASDTTCDGVDDDCDGFADEDYVPMAMTCGVGACASAGMTSCSGGALSFSCIPGMPAATDSTCNGEDDDCDGLVDEEYVSLATRCGVGACATTGMTSCSGGAVADSCVAGTPATSDTTCDGVDDDCDGLVDEEYVSAATRCGVGACATTGSMICSGGSLSDTCIPGAPAASDAACNGIDDDCDGLTDEDYVGVPTTCGIGACASTGTSSCYSGAVLDSCVAGTPAASDTTCDGVDDDCDGKVDEDGNCRDAGGIEAGASDGAARDSGTGTGGAGGNSGGGAAGSSTSSGGMSSVDGSAAGTGGARAAGGSATGNAGAGGGSASGGRDGGSRDASPPTTRDAEPGRGLKQGHDSGGCAFRAFTERSKDADEIVGAFLIGAWFVRRRRRRTSAVSRASS